MLFKEILDELFEFLAILLEALYFDLGEQKGWKDCLVDEFLSKAEEKLSTRSVGYCEGKHLYDVSGEIRALQLLVVFVVVLGYKE